jgi:hypothetical protein
MVTPWQPASSGDARLQPAACLDQDCRQWVAVLESFVVMHGWAAGVPAAGYRAIERLPHGALGP